MDLAWWRRYLNDVRVEFHGVLVSSHARIGEVRKVQFAHRENSGAGAIALAARLGAKRIILLGYDCQKTDGKAHWHGDHPAGLGNAGGVSDWPAQFGKVAADLAGIEIINCSRSTALRCWRRDSLEIVL